MPDHAHHLRPAAKGPLRHRVTPGTAGWRYLAVDLLDLDGTAPWTRPADRQEAAVVPLAGRARVRAGDVAAVLQRGSVFEDMPTVLYAPPGVEVAIEPDGPFECAIGAAPAAGGLPAAVVEPGRMRAEVRGGGAATRQVNHVLAHPLPAERLIVYEVYVPRGGWSGWPPHCHDGYEGSPYLEETYYFRLDPDDGWAMHRNYRLDTDFDESFAVGDRDLVLVTQGFHSSVAAPGNHMFFLNFLAGELEGDDRAIPPFFQPEYRWIDGHWDEGAWTLPRVRA